VFKKYIDIERLIHSIKTVIACLIGFLVTRIIGFPADQWIVITILVVMCAQLYVGSMLQKAYLRFLGTVIGCLVATITLLTVGETNVAIATTIGLSSFFFSYLATGQESLSYAGTLGAVTTAIIMLGQQPTVMLAGERFLEISLGILIATIISQFVLPIHARAHLRRTQALTLKQLRDYYTIRLIANEPDTQSPQAENLDEDIVKSLSKQRKLAKEAARERLGGDFDPARFLRTLHYEREILRAIDFMHNALIHIKKTESALLESPILHTFNAIVLESLDRLINAIESDKMAIKSIQVPSLQGLKIYLQKNISDLPEEELIYIDGLLFSAETLTTSLINLASLYNVATQE
jgi:uncharacterized membrane protein YccC